METADGPIGIVGTGIMGSGLTEVVAAAGFTVVLRSRTRDAAEATLAQVAASFGDDDEADYGERPPLI